jgi:hypothetical protein
MTVSYLLAKLIWYVTAPEPAVKVLTARRYRLTVVAAATVSRSEVVDDDATCVKVVRSAQVLLSAECWTLKSHAAERVLAVTCS